MAYKSNLLLKAAILLLVALWFPAASALAAGLPLESTGESATAGSTGRGLDEAGLEELIATLENDQQREQLVESLETLQKAKAQSGKYSKEDNPLAIADAILPEETAGQVVEKYARVLDGLGLSASGFSDLLITVGVMLVILLLVWLNRRLAKGFDRGLANFRRNFGLSPRRFCSYFRIQVWAGYAISCLLGLYTFSMVFPDSLGALLGEDRLIAIAEIVFSLILVTLVFMSIWEVINGAIEHFTHKRQQAVSARVRTLIPLVRNALLFFLTVMSLLVVLSEIGIDVMPLLAGAGVLGIAIGFGAQTLVKDFLTGFTILLEDLLQVDDVVTVGGRTGIVETITLRKVELRALDGTVHTVPFSEISIVDNLTKDYSYYMLEVAVAYRENTDEVISCLHEIDREMRDSEEFGRYMLDALEVFGVDRFDDSAVVIKARTRTVAHEKWFVGREFNRRIKLLFDARNIEIPFPHQTLYFGESKDGRATHADVRVLSAEQVDTDNDLAQEVGDNAGSETGGSVERERREEQSQCRHLPQLERESNSSEGTGDT